MFLVEAAGEQLPRAGPRGGGEGGAEGVVAVEGAAYAGVVGFGGEVAVGAVVAVCGVDGGAGRGGVVGEVAGGAVDVEAADRARGVGLDQTAQQVAGGGAVKGTAATARDQYESQDQQVGLSRDCSIKNEKLRP